MRPRSRPSGRVGSARRRADGPPRIRSVIERYCLQPSKMNPLKRLGIALWRTLLDQGDLIATQIFLPPIAGAISKHVRLAVTGTHIPHEGPSRLASYRQAVTRTMDGAVLDGEASGTWAKYAIPKGLPAEEGERRMAIENQAHSVEECSFVIKEGYGKGTKTLVYAGTATYKIDGESHFGRVAVHFHEADKAAHTVRPGVPEYRCTCRTCLRSICRVPRA